MKLRSEIFSAKIRAGTVALWWRSNLIAWAWAIVTGNSSTPRFTFIQKNHDDPAFFGQVPF
jgi:hypothetical protein